MKTPTAWKTWKSRARPRQPGLRPAPFWTASGGALRLGALAALLAGCAGAAYVQDAEARTPAGDDRDNLAATPSRPAQPQRTKAKRQLHPHGEAGQGANKERRQARQRRETKTSRPRDTLSIKFTWKKAPVLPSRRPLAPSWLSFLVPPPPPPRPLMRVYAEPPPREELLYLELDIGQVVIRMRPDHAPETVLRMTELARNGFYEGAVFFRVLDGLLAEAGAFDGAGKKEAPPQDEGSSLVPLRGTVGLARAGGEDEAAGAPFFILLAPAPFFDGQYTFWGEVVRGMKLVDRIHKGHPRTGLVTDAPTRILALRPAQDIASKDTVASGMDAESAP